MWELWNLAMVCLLLFVSLPAEAQRNAWIATWATSPQSVAPNPRQPLLNIEGQTVRERIRVSVGGAQIRLRLSNEYGATPLLIGSATVAVPNDWLSVQIDSIQSVTFRGHNSTTIPAGEQVLSDPRGLSRFSRSRDQHQPLFSASRCHSDAASSCTQARRGLATWRSYS